MPLYCERLNKVHLDHIGTTINVQNGVFDECSWFDGENWNLVKSTGSWPDQDKK